VASLALESVKRTNRLELLMFGLGTKQRFGMNVLKVKELLPCPKLTPVPGSHRTVCGITHMRGQTVSVIDLAIGIDLAHERHNDFLILAEINRSTYGFLVGAIERIVVIDWQDVKPPARSLGAASYMTGVIEIDDTLVQILDVERVLGEVGIANADKGLISIDTIDITGVAPILVVDDSAMARNQTARILQSIGIPYVLMQDGKQAFEFLTGLVDGGGCIHDNISMVISDIEMPAMDGYTLTRGIREDVRLQSLYVLLHSSLNGMVNNELANVVGADATLTKFVPSELSNAIEVGIKKHRVARS